MGFWRSWAARAATWPTCGNPGVGDEATAFLQGELLEQLLAGGSYENHPGMGLAQRRRPRERGPVRGGRAVSATARGSPAGAGVG